MEDKHRRVVITGASSGFGAGAVKAFADRGYRVWGTMRDVEGRNASKRDALQAHAPGIAVIGMDVTDGASVDAAFAEILAEGPIDVLINNAGIMYIGTTEAYSVEQAQAQMDTNYFGAIRCIQAVLPAMREAGSGLIINTSSIAGRVAVPFFGTYCATKHALEAYSQGLRYEVAPFGVDVALVEPGPFGTNLLAGSQPPAHEAVRASYGDLGDVPTQMISDFAETLSGDDAPNPQWVVDTYVGLAEAPAGHRPTRTVVGIDWGVEDLNANTQGIQDHILAEMGLDTVLGGADAGPADPSSRDVETVRAFYADVLTAPAETTAERYYELFSPEVVSIPTPPGGPGAQGMLDTIAYLGQVVPDLTWDPQEIIALEDGRYVVRGLAAGTPIGPFFAVEEPTGRSFEIMSIDIVTVEDSRIVHIHHLEDWTGAIAQLTSGGAAGDEGS